MKGFFVTGTDTDCGKTRVACALIEKLRGQGLKVAPFKPVAAGARWVNGQLRNDDALRLIEAAGGGWDYDLVNPYCFEPPVSPHLAAAEAQRPIELPLILDAARRLAAAADLLIVEGAGGWLVPLGDRLDIADLASALGLPVLLVVGLRLGCLNHARLSAAQIAASGLPLVGWIGSQLDPAMLYAEANLETLKQCLLMPCCGVLPHLESGADASGYVQLHGLL